MSIVNHENDQKIPNGRLDKPRPLFTAERHDSNGGDNDCPPGSGDAHGFLVA